MTMPYDRHTAMPSLSWGRLVGFALCGLALWALIGYAFYYALTLPVVYEAYPSGECMRVDDVNGRYSCDNMPTKYHHEWVMQER